MTPPRRLRPLTAAALLAVALAAGRARAAAPHYVAIVGSDDPFAGIAVGSFTTPALGDLDGDGDLDFLAGEQTGALFYFENVGSVATPSFAARTGAANPFDGISVAGYSWPALVDLDGDGDLDLVVGQHLGALRYFENTGSAVAPAFIERTGVANPFDGIVAGDVPAPGFADLDGDGDLDLVVGSADGTFVYFENTGTPLAPAFIQRTGAANPLDGQDVGNFSTATLADADGDGDPDLVSGLPSGAFAWFENTGSPQAPVFTALAGDASPLFGVSAGSFSTPVFADLDGDGDADIVTGSGTRFRWLRAPEPGAVAAQFAALASVAGLVRWRARHAGRVASRA